MGMSKSQKARKYGTDRPFPTPSQASTTPTPEQTRGRRVHEMPPGTFAAQPGKSSSAAIVVGVALAVGMAMWAYYHFLILPGFSAQMASGLTAPELLAGGFDAAYAQRFAAALGTDGLRDYSSLHASIGLFTPLFTALGWLLFCGLNTPGRVRKWVYWAVVLAYAVVFLAGNSALDAALAHPADLAAVRLASGLVLARWLLLAALLVIAVLVVVSVFRRKLDAFAGGRLPGQRPRP